MPRNDTSGHCLACCRCCTPGTAAWAITPHVHLLITGGGITADGQHWEPARGEFLVPIAALSRKIAAQFRAALEAAAPAVFAVIPAGVWHREWVSFCKHYGHGNDAVLTYRSRYVFRTAISNARILGMDQTHVTFRWKDRGADAWPSSGCRALSSSGASSSTSCRAAFTRSDTTGSGTPRSETSPIVPGCS